MTDAETFNFPSLQAALIVFMILAIVSILFMLILACLYCAGGNRGSQGQQGYYPAPTNANAAAPYKAATQANYENTNNASGTARRYTHRFVTMPNVLP